MPIKKLLSEAKAQYYVDHQARTIVRRPNFFNLGNFGGHHNWKQVLDRPVRDMRTVVMDQQQKLALLDDINEYLRPGTTRWYANRGIPLRRGYLFYGPPGTGKTSLSFALAGVFGLGIYVISLKEPDLTEENLAELFSSLPRRCIVLLEDIDSAGLRRPINQIKQEEKADKDDENGQEDDDNESSNKKGHSSDWKVSDLAKALKIEGSNNDENKGISLSGLLNVIDGVASHEGHLIIMTTNAPNSLDDALMRPGRIDFQVGFTNATTVQVEELFIRMYETESKANVAVRGSGDGATSTASPEKHRQAEKESEHVMDPREEPLDISKKELLSVANQFARKIPDGKLSAAEIQGYLLKRKRHPLRALRKADEWVSALEQKKASRSKILKV